MSPSPLLLLACGTGPSESHDEQESSSGGYSKVAVVVSSNLIFNCLLRLTSSEPVPIITLSPSKSSGGSQLAITDFEDEFAPRALQLKWLLLMCRMVFVLRPLVSVVLRRTYAADDDDKLDDAIKLATVAEITLGDETNDDHEAERLLLWQLSSCEELAVMQTMVSCF
jgi:hypothetical protein